MCDLLSHRCYCVGKVLNMKFPCVVCGAAVLDWCYLFVAVVVHLCVSVGRSSTYPNGLSVFVCFFIVFAKFRFQNVCRPTEVHIEPKSNRTKALRRRIQVRIRL